MKSRLTPLVASTPDATFWTSLVGTTMPGVVLAGVGEGVGVDVVLVDEVGWVVVVVVVVVVDVVGVVVVVGGGVVVVVVVG